MLTGQVLFQDIQVNAVATTDSDTATVSITASGTNTLQAVDSGKALPTITASGTSPLVAVDTGKALPTITASGTETRAHFDSGTATVGITASGTETRSHTDSGTALPVITHPSSTDIHINVDTGKALPVITASGTSPLTAVDAKTAAVGFSPSGTDLHTIFDTGKALPIITASGIEGRARIDSGTATVTFTPALTSEIYGHAPSTDDDIGGFYINAGTIAPSGSPTTFSGTYAQNIPAGYLVIYTVVANTALASGITDAGSNTISSYDTISIGGSTQVHMAVFTSILTTAVTAGDAVNVTMASATSGIVVGMTAYNGTLSSSTLDTIAGGKTAVTSGTSNTVTGGHVTAQAYETLYAAFGFTNGVSAPNLDNTYAKRINTSSSSGARTVVVTDKSVYSTGTYSTGMTWTNNASVAGILICIKQAKLPSVVGFTPSLAEVLVYSETPTDIVHFTPSLTSDIGAATDAKTCNLITTPSGTETKNERPPDTGTVNLTTDTSFSSETFIHTDKATAFVNFTQPFRQDVQLGPDAGTAFVFTLPGDKTPHLGTFDSCLHCTLTPRYAAAPVGARYLANGFVRYVAIGTKRWLNKDVGKCPS